MKKYTYLLTTLLALSMSTGVFAKAEKPTKPEDPPTPPSAQAPAYSAFHGYGLSGISLSPAGINMGQLTYDLSLNAAPTLYDGVNVYAITEIWGFWAIGHNFTGEDSDAVTDETWTFGVKYVGEDGSSVAGWDDANKNRVITPGGAAKRFTFTSLIGDTGETSDARMGLHVSVALDGKGYPVGFGSGVTAFVYNDGRVPPKAVPESSTLAGFGSSLLIAAPGLIGWLRRRRA
jgi:hypothetical protein